MTVLAPARSPRVQICGITRADDAAAAVQAGADLLGFNFYPRSPRYITPEAAAPIIRSLPREVLAVGVFVDPAREDVDRAIDVAALALLQFHGDEPAEFCRGFPVPAMKALRVTRLAELPAAAGGYRDGWLLVDTADPLRRGGTGRALAIDPVAPELASRLFLAGGLTPETVAAAVRRLRPLGVDVCSGVERAPGAKDPERVRSFVANAKSA